MSTSLPTPPAGFIYQAMEIASSVNTAIDAVESITGIAIDAGKTIDQFVSYYENTDVGAVLYTCPNGSLFLCVIVPDSTPNNSTAVFSNPSTGNYNVSQETCSVDEGTLRPPRC